MKKMIAALAAAAVVLLSACSSTPPNDNTVQGPQPQPSIDQEQTPSATPTPTPKRASSAPFGGTVTFPSGVKVSVSVPKVVAAGQYAYGDVDGKLTVVTLTVTNESQEPINAALMGYPRATYGAKGAEATPGYSSTVGAGSLSTILPGETQSLDIAYGVPEAEVPSLRLEVRGPNFDDFPAIFKGQ